MRRRSGHLIQKSQLPGISAHDKCDNPNSIRLRRGRKFLRRVYIDIDGVSNYAICLQELGIKEAAGQFGAVLGLVLGLDKKVKGDLRPEQPQ